MNVRETTKFYKHKRVLITGHTGFMGQWLAMILHNMGADVTGLSLGKTTYTDIFLPPKLLQSPRVDIHDYSAVFKYINDIKPEVVFHFAARTLVEDAFNEPLDTVRTNVLGTANLFEVCRSLESVQAIINATTDKVYRTDGQEPFRENASLGSKELYGASKAAADMLANAYCTTYLLPKKVGVATVRCGNVIGGGDANMSRLVPHVVESLSANKDVKTQGDINAVRPWQFILEPLYGYIELAHRLVERPDFYSGAWNFGPTLERAVSVAEIVKMTMDAWGTYRGWVQNDPRHYLETDRLLIDSSKAKELLGWSTHLSIEETIKRAVAWYKQFYRCEDISKYSMEQLEKYENEISFRV